MDIQLNPMSVCLDKLSETAHSAFHEIRSCTKLARARQIGNKNKTAFFLCDKKVVNGKSDTQIYYTFYNIECSILMLTWQEVLFLSSNNSTSVKLCNSLLTQSCRMMPQRWLYTTSSQRYQLMLIFTIFTTHPDLNRFLLFPWTSNYPETEWTIQCSLAHAFQSTRLKK